MNQSLFGAPARVLVVTACLFAANRASADLGRARSAFSEWARTKSLVSAESAEWAREKALLADTLATARAESEALDARIAAMAGSSTEAEKRRVALRTEIDEAAATATALTGHVGAAEDGIRALVPLLPVPLRGELQPLLSRLPNPEGGAALPLAQRLQTIAALLAQIEKFASSLSLFSEVRVVDGSSEREVKTLYFGTAAAYFADVSGSVAGHGVATPAGWEWRTVQGELATRISRAIAIHENTQPAAFVSLPVEIR